MIGKKNFWKEESNAPLFNKNNGYLKFDSDHKEILERIKKWPSLYNIKIKEKYEELENNKIVKTIGTDETKNQLRNEEIDRIIIKDIERTFAGESQRKILKELLTASYNNFQEYHQGLSYVSSFLIIHFDLNTTFGILSELNFNKKYLFGYWQTIPVEYATDAYVFYYLVEKYHPEIYKHLNDLFLLPETFCQKWFVGLAVHCLTFEPLYLFFEQFLEHGYVFLFQFGLALLETLKEKILSSKQNSQVYQILRLEEPIVEPFFGLKIVERAISNPYDFSDCNFEELRKKLYEEKLKDRLEAADRQLEEDSDDFSFDSDSDGDGLECGICQENMPEYLNFDCKLLICEDCYDSEREPHLKTHKVVPIGDIDDLDEALKALRLKDDTIQISENNIISESVPELSSEDVIQIESKSSEDNQINNSNRIKSVTFENLPDFDSSKEEEIKNHKEYSEKDSLIQKENNDSKLNCCIVL